MKTNPSFFLQASLTAVVTLGAQACAHAVLISGPWTQPSGGAALSGVGPGTLTWGNGSADNADASSVFSALPASITLANPGDQLVVGGSVAMSGITAAAEVFRFGVFNVNGSANANGWLGYFIQNSNTTTGGTLRERDNPNTGQFTSTTGANTIMATATVPNSALTNSTYTLSVTLTRNASSGLQVTTSLKRVSDGVDFAAVTWLDTSPQTFTFNRVGLQGTTNLNADQIVISGLDSAFVAAPVPEPAAGLLGGLGALAAFNRRRRKA